MGHRASECNFSRAPLTTKSVKIHNHIQAQGTTVLHALADICADVTPAEKMAHQDLDMENCPVQLMLLSNAWGPVSPPLVEYFIYISCGRKWGKGRGNTTLQLSAKPHSAFSVLTQSSEYFLHQLIFLQNPSFPLPLRLYPMQGTTAMTFALGSSNKPS